jgi:succinate dehydrogenase / fumarate reductase cytochrome b subunit
MPFLKSTVGRKIMMAITGLMMLFFVIIHVIGNSTIYFGWLNAYAEHLHALPPLVWVFRLFMLTIFSLHLFFGIQLALENRAAKPKSYELKKSLRATFASKNMIWTGLIVAAFLVYHLLHFTVQVTNPEISSGNNLDTLGRPDVFRMVVLSFRNFFISSLYVGAMVALAFHLTHGIQSFFQTLGLNSDSTFPVITRAGTLAAVILSLGYIAIPLLIVAGMLKG